MSLVKNLSLIFKCVPDGLPIPGKHLVVEDRPSNISRAPDGGFVTRNLYCSLDPYMRLMLIESSTRHYRRPFVLGQPIRSLSVAEVIASSHPDFPTGSMIRASLPIQQYSVVTNEDPSMLGGATSNGSIRVLPQSLSPLMCPPFWIGPLGMPGLTAFSSIYEIGRIQPGETIFISAAAGAVGQIVGQICKLEGLRVIGSVGSDEKVDLLVNELGFDAAFNYRQESTSSALQRLAPAGLDIYYDNVGGQTLEDALASMAQDGRIIVCGMISQYNSTYKSTTSESTYGVKNLFQLVGQNLEMRGFQVGHRDFGPKHMRDHEEKTLRWIEERKLQAVMSEVRGIQHGADAFVGMLQGESVGKAILRIWADDEEGTHRNFPSFHRIS
ncbi:hypothetical protein LTR03_014387 [Friedmanniomyces endolithicus]|nr:hypothetical protein LTR03_014387 [Friedmanniomyces endolithicus]